VPPQGAVLAAALAWNYQRSRTGKPTISQTARRHPIASAALLLGFNAYIWPHIYGTPRA